MTLRPALLLSLALSLAAVAPVSAAGMSATLDPDKDGTIDMVETMKAASALFDRLDRDRDGTLDARELRGRISASEFASADPDKDGTLNKLEYFGVVAKRFWAANPDHDLTIDAKELASPAGQALLKLLQ